MRVVEKRVMKVKNTKNFYAVLKDIKNNGSTTEKISVKSHGSNINLHTLIITNYIH